MRKILAVLVLLGVAVFAVPQASAQQCSTSTVIGDFQVDYNGAVFDGTNTTFDYCVTGLGGSNFRALSNWLIALDTLCISSSDLTDCSSANCYYQANDPNHNLSGIKFDSVQVNAGQTVCYSFSLAGDWTRQIGDTTASLKAGTSVDSGPICGPTCRMCQLTMSVNTANVSTPELDLYLRHVRPATVTGPIRFFVYDSAGTLVLSWSTAPITLNQGSVYTLQQPLPVTSPLAPGNYKLLLQMQGMAGWITRSTFFTVK